MLFTETTTPAPGWGQILAFGKDFAINLAQIALIVAAAILVAWLMRIIIRRVVGRIVNGAKSKAKVDDTRALDHSPLAQVRIVQRTRTLGTILQNIVNVTTVLIALFAIVMVIDRDLLGSFTLLSAAIGAGLGFGAQNIVRDVLNGIFIVAEDQVGIGDVVDVGLATGVVEFVSVRVTHVRDVNGTLWYVRNGEITRIGNMSQGWSRVIIDLSLPRDVDVAEVEKTVLHAASTLFDDPKWRSRVVERPEMWGLESIDAETLVIRVVMKSRSNAKDDVAQELRMRLKKAISGYGMQVPQLRSVVLSGPEGAQRVRGANMPTTRPNIIPPTAARPSWRPRKPKPEAQTGPDARPDADREGDADE